MFIKRNAVGCLLLVHVPCYVMFSKFCGISVCNKADAIGALLHKALSLEVNTSSKLVVKVIIWHREIYPCSLFKNYLGIFKSYIHPSVELENLDALEFCTPNSEKSSKEKSAFKFSPHFESESHNDIIKIIMVFWK